jgi:hypothetical protein
MATGRQMDKHEENLCPLLAGLYSNFSEHDVLALNRLGSFHDDKYDVGRVCLRKHQISNTSEAIGKYYS